MKILVVSPVFHGYWEAIVGALATHGHDVEAHCYDAPPQWTARAANAASFRLSALRPFVERRATAAAIAALARTKPDAVLVVRGDSLGSDWWDACAHLGVRTAVWLYDELGRMKYDRTTLKAVETVYSYSRPDVSTLAARGVNAEFLPDAYDSLLPYSPRTSTAVSFIGARYPPRERALRAVAGAGIAVEAYGREWSRHPWDVLRTRRWRPAGIPSGRDLSRSDYYGAMAGSLATMNIHGEGFQGVSMRTFEAPGVGALQLIDRPAVDEFYDVGSEVLVFHTDEELVDHLKRARRDRGWAAQIRKAGQARTLAEHTFIHRMRAVQEKWK